MHAQSSTCRSRPLLRRCLMDASNGSGRRQSLHVQHTVTAYSESSHTVQASSTMQPIQRDLIKGCATRKKWRRKITRARVAMEIQEPAGKGPWKSRSHSEQPHVTHLMSAMAGKASQAAKAKHRPTGQRAHTRQSTRTATSLAQTPQAQGSTEWPTPGRCRK